MWSNKNVALIQRILLLLTLLVVALWVIFGGIMGGSNAQSQPQNIADLPQNVKSRLDPQPTVEPPLPGLTPTASIARSTSTPAVLQAAVLVTPASISTLAPTGNAFPPPKSSFNSREAIDSMALAPTGDKLLYVTNSYVTNSANLYWANLDGSNPTLLHQYESDAVWSMLEDQQPMSNTLILRHGGPVQGEGRGPGHLDVVHFTPGQPPTLDEVDDAGFVFQIRWWRPDRASSIVIGAYVGGDQLVTLDANGHLVERRNIPYMYAGAVQPGGIWLAYATGQQASSTAFVGSSPQTIYLLNLNTGRRLQLTLPGMGWRVFSWSPDGNWIYASAIVNGGLEGVIISADGTQWIVMTPAGNSGWDVVWSPDSKHLAFSIQSGGQDDPNSPPVPYNSQVYLVDVPARTVTISDSGGPPTSSTNLMMQPKWSPDGSQLALLTFDPACIGLCSGLSPALYLLPFSSK
jgi:hypothetical protein